MAQSRIGFQGAVIVTEEPKKLSVKKKQLQLSSQLIKVTWGLGYGKCAVSVIFPVQPGADWVIEIRRWKSQDNVVISGQSSMMAVRGKAVTLLLEKVEEWGNAKPLMSESYRRQGQALAKRIGSWIYLDNF